jgi:putative exporter of polyketide antibiotics
MNYFYFTPQLKLLDYPLKQNSFSFLMWVTGITMIFLVVIYNKTHRVEPSSSTRVSQGVDEVNSRIE